MQVDGDMSETLYHTNFFIEALFVGLTVPIPILYNEKISDIATVLSFGFLFLSMWQVEKNAERKAQWEDIQLMATISQQPSQQNSETTNT